MPALGFKQEFGPAVENGLALRRGDRRWPHPGVMPKVQTIRANRKDGRDPKPGQPLYLFTGMRTKRSRRLGEAECVSVGPLWINGSVLHVLDHWMFRLGAWDRRTRAHRFAEADGFRNAEAMWEFFERVHGLPFEGYLIRW